MASKPYQGASRTNDEIKSIRVPVIGSLLSRGTSASKDQRYVNGYFDVLVNQETQKKHYYFTKRPAFTQTNGIRPPAGNATARGCYTWNNKLYSVFNNKIYSGTTDLGVTLSGSSGECGFAETRPGAGTQYLCINDGVKLYCISTADAVTTVTVNFPTPNTTDLVYMDGYFFVAKSDGRIFHCSLDDPTTWDTSKFITAQQFNGNLVGLAHQNNILMALMEKACPMFYDNANSAGSVLNLYEQAVQQMGCASQASICTNEEYIVWVGASTAGGYTVQRMDGIGAPKTVSTAAIERVLNAEGSSISSCVAYGMRICGKLLYILNLSSANRTFVYDYVEDLWVEWESAAGGTAWPIYSSTLFGGKMVVQHQTNGWLYVLSPDVYQDDSTNFTVLMRTARLDFDTNLRKYVRKVGIIGDIQSSTANTSLQYSDDDYVTLSTARTLDMSQPHCFSMNLGNFFRRSFQLSYSGNTPWRVEGLEFHVRVGQS